MDPTTITFELGGWIALFIVITLAVLAARIEFGSRSRPCARCGHPVKNGVLDCGKCGFDFRTIGEPRRPCPMAGRFETTLETVPYRPRPEIREKLADDRDYLRTLRRRRERMPDSHLFDLADLEARQAKELTELDELIGRVETAVRRSEEALERFEP